MFRSFRSPGLVWKDDFVPRHPIYSYISLFAWNPLEHGGALNDDLSNALLNSIRSYLSGIFGIEIVSKLYVMSIISLCGIFMFMALNLFRSRYYGLNSKLPCLIGALTYMVNPWVTSRILSGHFFLLSSYMLTPIFLYFLLDYFDGNKISGLKSSLVLGLIAMTSNHGLIMNIFLTLILLIWHLFSIVKFYVG